MNSLDIERLCGHHDAASFESGDADLNAKLEMFQRRFRAGEDILVYVVTEENSDEVVGYIAIDETQFESDETGDVIHYFVIPAMAVVERFRAGGDTFNRLRQRAEDAIDLRRKMAREIAYRGIIALPRTNPRLPRVLEHLGFLQFEGNSELMWKPFAT